MELRLHNNMKSVLCFCITIRLNIRLAYMEKLYYTKLYVTPALQGFVVNLITEVWWSPCLKRTLAKSVESPLAAPWGTESVVGLESPQHSWTRLQSLQECGSCEVWTFGFSLFVSQKETVAVLLLSSHLCLSGGSSLSMVLNARSGENLFQQCHLWICLLNISLCRNCCHWCYTAHRVKG